MRGKGVGETLKNILEKEGVAGLFRCRSGPAAALLAVSNVCTWQQSITCEF